MSGNGGQHRVSHLLKTQPARVDRPEPGVALGSLRKQCADAFTKLGIGQLPVLPPAGRLFRANLFRARLLRARLYRGLVSGGR